MRAKITRYPNNEIRVAVYPEKFPKPIESLNNGSPFELGNESDEQLITPLVERPDLFSEQDDSPLDIKSKDDTPCRPRRWALSRNGRNQLLRAGACFDNTPQTERLLLTGTLPGSTIAAFRALAQFSTYASKTLTNWITRHNPGCKWEYAWEFQKRGALHIHLVIEVPLSVSSYVKVHFKDEWNRIIRAICSKSGTDLYAKRENYSHDPQKTQADVTVCDREPSRYISKYISKNATNAHGFNRFPPKQWYQCSRSLLKALAAQTQTFIQEGLSHRQALCFIEDAQTNLCQSALAGWRRFEGCVLAWSGYCYADTFEITDWGKNFMDVRKQTLSIEHIAKRAIATSKEYPQVRCYLKTCNATGIETAMRSQDVSDTEMLLLIQTITEALITKWDFLHSKVIAARFLQQSINWWQAKFGYCQWTPEFRLAIDKICEDSLTR